jgi:hypothetical protein
VPVPVTVSQAAGDRGYDAEYRRARKAWAVVVASGHAFCVEPRCIAPDRYIRPGSAWHLSHNPERTLILGPSHSACNLSEAGRRGNPKGVAKRRRVKQWRPRRRW